MGSFIGLLLLLRHYSHSIMLSYAICYFTMSLSISIPSRMYSANMVWPYGTNVWARCGVHTTSYTSIKSSVKYSSLEEDDRMNRLLWKLKFPKPWSDKAKVEKKRDDEEEEKMIMKRMWRKNRKSWRYCHMSVIRHGVCVDECIYWILTTRNYKHSH